MDAETLTVFLEEAESYLPTMREGIIAYEQDSSRIAELQATRRQAHTIKGSAFMAKLPEIGETAKELEGDLKIVIQSRTALTEETASEFLSRIMIIEAYLNKLRSKLDEVSKDVLHLDQQAEFSLNSKVSTKAARKTKRKNLKLTGKCRRFSLRKPKTC